MTSVDGTVSRGYSKLVQRGKYVAALYRPPPKSRSILVYTVRAHNCAEKVQSAQLYLGPGVIQTSMDPRDCSVHTHGNAMCKRFRV